MRLNEVNFDVAPPIDGYGPDFFRVQNNVRNGPLAMLPTGPVDWFGFPDVSIFLAHSEEIDVLLVGMGAEIAALPAELRNSLEEAGIGVEVMATPPACRTFNVLLAEGRRVAAALMPV